MIATIAIVKADQTFNFRTLIRLFASTNSFGLTTISTWHRHWHYVLALKSYDILPEILIAFEACMHAHFMWLTIRCFIVRAGNIYKQCKQHFRLVNLLKTFETNSNYIFNKFYTRVYTLRVFLFFISSTLLFFDDILFPCMILQTEKMFSNQSKCGKILNRKWVRCEYKPKSKTKEEKTHTQQKFLLFHPACDQ